MALTTFKRTPTKVTDADVVDVESTTTSGDATQAMVPAPRAGAVDVTRPKYAGLEGEFSSRDAAIPYIAIGQKSGTMCDDHPDWIGQFVFDKVLPLSNKITFTVLSLRKFYEEVTEYGGDEIPKRFDTVAAAKASGVEFRDVANIDILVEIPADQAENFGVLDHNGKHYAAARWGVRSTAYGKTVSIIYRDLSTWLKGDLSSGFYTATAEKKTNGHNSWFAPSLKTAGLVPAELREAIRAQYQG
jgi:hypothetical protein